MVGAALASALSTIPNMHILVIESSAALNTASESNSRGYCYQYDARCITLARGSAEIFHQIGIWSNLRTQASPIQEIEVSEKGQFGRSSIKAQDEKVPALGYVVEHHWLMSVLYDYLATCSNVEFVAPCAVQSVQPTAEGYTVEVYHQHKQQLLQYDASLLVVADGTGSGLRQQLGIQTEGYDYQQSALVTTLTPEKGHERCAFERFTETGPLAILPLNDQRCGLVWTLTPEAAAEVSELSDEHFLGMLQREFGNRLGRFLKVGRRSLFPLQRTISKEQVRPNLVVLGNAAHTLHPVAGQGFNLSVRDIAVLTRCLRQRSEAQLALGDIDTLLEYQKNRQADQAKISHFSDKLLRLFLHQNRGVTLARNIGLVTFDLWPGAKKMLAKHAMGTLTHTSLQ